MLNFLTLAFPPLRSQARFETCKTFTTAFQEISCSFFFIASIFIRFKPCYDTDYDNEKHLNNYAGLEAKKLISREMLKC